MRIVCISDTHNKLKTLIDEGRVPDGDVLVVAGDFTMLGRQHEVEGFRDQLRRLPHRWKLIVAGNHDLSFQHHGNKALDWLDAVVIPAPHGRWPAGPNPDFLKFVDVAKMDWLEQRQPTCLYLEDSGVIIDGFTFWGSPWQPLFGNWAFNIRRGDPALARVWELVPQDVDVLVTHGPPQGVGDQLHDGRRVGCELLANELYRIQPQVHVFGHIHEGRLETGAVGKVTSLPHNGPTRDMEQAFLAVNASICDEDYDPIHDPVVVDLLPRAR